MTEVEYVRVRNLSNVMVAMYCMKDMLGGCDGVTTDVEVRGVLRRLADMRERLFVVDGIETEDVTVDGIETEDG